MMDNMGVRTPDITWQCTRILCTTTTVLCRV